MTQTQHTKGPWNTKSRNGKTPEVMAGQYQVAVLGIGAATSEEESANAALIAAAPELLEACIAVLLECPGIWKTCQQTEETFGAMLSAAIDKAVGNK